jgi:hypothetical protein
VKTAKLIADLIVEQLKVIWTGRYTFQAWAFDRSPPPSLPWPVIVVVNAGLVVAARIAFPHADWLGLPVFAALLPVAALAAFYGLRSWSRPRPVAGDRDYHAYAQTQSAELKASGSEVFRHYVPMSFSTALQGSVVIVVALFYTVLGNCVFLAMLELDVPGGTTVGFIVWGGAALLALFAFLVGGIGWPRWPMPFVVREAYRTGKPIFTAEDHRPPEPRALP